jgi:enamine deaminase RidA (YjgF/YER057c/UK114 family)
MREFTPYRSRLTFHPGAGRLAVEAEATGIRLFCPMPRLAGPDHQCLATGSRVRPLEGGALIEGNDGDVSGVLLAEQDSPLELATERLYFRFLDLLGSRRIRRVWVFVPAINRHMDGQENYLAFNAGRHRALTRWFGEISTAALPAASVLGIGGDRLGLAFSAGVTPVTHFENPLQVPACCYPERYGKFPPLFARGASTGSGSDRIWHLSGTASIQGSETIGDEISRQTVTTIENCRIVLDRMGVPPDLPGCWKVFLRHAEDLDAARSLIEMAWPSSAHQWLYLRADICRPDLLVEIEALFDSTCHPAFAAGGEPRPSLSHEN